MNTLLFRDTISYCIIPFTHSLAFCLPLDISTNRTEYAPHHIARYLIAYSNPEVPASVKKKFMFIYIVAKKAVSLDFYFQL